MIQCTGNCITCGRCMNTMTDNQKAAMLKFPADLHFDKKEGLGLAIDIGTTTVAMTLWDLNEGKMLASDSHTNRQCIHGADVITRISYCVANENGLDKLKSLLFDGINESIDRLCAKAEASNGEDKKTYSPNQIVRVIVCGNTTMSHIFAGYSPESLARAPFSPQYEGVIEMLARDQALNINPGGKISVIPNIAGHVGGDITAGILAVRILQKGKNHVYQDAKHLLCSDATDPKAPLCANNEDPLYTDDEKSLLTGNDNPLHSANGLILYIDIGTNGEIVLTDGKRTLTSSTSAGPALEGAAIENGMRAGDGAIERVVISNSAVEISVIGSTIATGICGSGIIDAVAQMLKTGILDNTGRIQGASKLDSEELASRVLETETGRVFALTDTVVITQNDIRQIQLAKGAIQAGTQLLLKKLGRTVAEIDKVKVAGSFGNHIDVRSATAIGLLPGVAFDKIEFVGNASGAGVAMALVSDNEMKAIKRIPELIEHIDLALEDEFQEVYLKCMGF